MRLPLLAPLILASALVSPLAAKVEIEAQHLHSLLYADLDTQPLLRLRIHCEKEGTTLESLRFQVTGGGALKALSLYRAGNEGRARLFSLRAARTQERCTTIRMSPKRAKDSVTFTGSLKLKKGDNFIWLTGSTTKAAAGNMRVDAELTQVKTSDPETTITAGDPQGTLEVYPFAQRIVPYYRDKQLMQWFPDQLTPRDFRYITDIIYFNLTCDHSGNLVGGDKQEFIAGIHKLKKLRGKQPVDIILGIAHSDPGFTATSANPEARRRFAQQIAAYLEKYKLDGVDIDWEYPDNDEQWIYFSYMINDIREELGASGRTVSSAVNMNYQAPNQLAIDVLDYVNIMSYDRGGEHATMAHFKEDIERSLRMMPKQKIIMGLPYYTNDMEGTRDWGAQKGYHDVVKGRPRLTARDNHTMFNGRRHYFNGAALIEEKCILAKRERMGGVMIWAYECDIPLKSKISLRRATFKHIRRTER